MNALSWLIFWTYEETNVCKIFRHIKDQCFLFSGISIQRRISGTIGASKISEIRATKDWKLCHRVLQGSRFKDRRCFEQNYTARAHSNRCSSENIQEATSWPGNTTVSKVSTIRKRRESEKRTSFVDRKWRSELKTFLLSFFVVFFSVFFLFHTVVLSFFSSLRPAFSTFPSRCKFCFVELPSIFGGTATRMFT